MGIGKTVEIPKLGWCGGLAERVRGAVDHASVGVVVDVDRANYLFAVVTICFDDSIRDFRAAADDLDAVDRGEPVPPSKTHPELAGRAALEAERRRRIRDVGATRKNAFIFEASVLQDAADRMRPSNRRRALAQMELERCRLEARGGSIHAAHTKLMGEGLVAPAPLPEPVVAVEKPAKHKTKKAHVFSDWDADDERALAAAYGGRAASRLQDLHSYRRRKSHGSSSEEIRAAVRSPSEDPRQGRRRDRSPSEDPRRRRPAASPRSFALGLSASPGVAVASLRSVRSAPRRRRDPRRPRRVSRRRRLGVGTARPWTARTSRA